MKAKFTSTTNHTSTSHDLIHTINDHNNALTPLQSTHLAAFLATWLNISFVSTTHGSHLSNQPGPNLIFLDGLPPTLLTLTLSNSLLTFSLCKQILVRKLPQRTLQQHLPYSHPFYLVQTSIWHLVAFPRHTPPQCHFCFIQSPFTSSLALASA